MTHVTLGSTGIVVNKNGFGALPIQRISKEAAVVLLRRAYEGGMNFFDTARFYTDSEKKLGEAFGDMRDEIYLATKTMALTAEDFWDHLETSLKALKTDHVDLYQFHNPRSVRSREMEAAFMKRCWRQKLRGRSDISELPITVWGWLMRRLTAAFMRHCSFLSAIWLRNTNWSWLKSVRKLIWALLP